MNLEDSGDEGADLTQFFEVKAEEEEVLDPYIIDSPQIPVEGEGAAQGEGGTKGGEEDVLMETLVEMDPYQGVVEEASENIHPKEHEGEQDMDLTTRSKTEALQDKKTSISEKTEEAEKPKQDIDDRILRLKFLVWIQLLTVFILFFFIARSSH